MAKGRSFSRVRTPALVRDYLSGEAFPGAPEEDGTPGPQEAIDPGRGDFIASIHRHVKRRIKELDPEYHWPRYHSFATLMRNLMKLQLVEHTGETETSDVLVLQGDPDGGGLSPGDLRLDPARGFQQRYYWRLTSDSQDDPVWENPMASVRAIYGIELVARPRAPRPEPEQEAAPARPPRRTRRTRRPAAPEEAPAPVSEGLQELHRQLEVRRQELLDQTRSAAQSGETVEIFESLEMDISDFLEVQVRPLYRSFPIRMSTLLLDLGTLTGCIQAFTRAESDGQRAVSLGSCRRGAAVLASSLALPLPVPDFEPAAAPPRSPVAPEYEEEVDEAAQEEAGPSPETIADLTARWSTLTDRITGWARPNSINAENLLARFVQEMTEAHPEIQEDDLDSAIEEARGALEGYQEEEDPTEREGAWEGFVEALGEVDFSELAEE